MTDEAGSDDAGLLEWPWSARYHLLKNARETIEQDTRDIIFKLKRIAEKSETMKLAEEAYGP